MSILSQQISQSVKDQKVVPSQCTQPLVGHFKGLRRAPQATTQCTSVFSCQLPILMTCSIVMLRSYGSLTFCLIGMRNWWFDPGKIKKQLNFSNAKHRGFRWTMFSVMPPLSCANLVLWNSQAQFSPSCLVWGVQRGNFRGTPRKLLSTLVRLISSLRQAMFLSFNPKKSPNQRRPGTFPTTCCVTTINQDWSSIAHSGIKVYLWMISFCQGLHLAHHCWAFFWDSAKTTWL